MTLSAWIPPGLPPRTEMQGRYVRLEPLARGHIDDLLDAFAEDAQMWRYMPFGPFDHASYTTFVDQARTNADPLHFAIRMADGRLGGTLSLMRITPDAGTIEIGWLAFAPRLQKQREATEAVYLLMRWSFEAGYRRCEWKCHTQNHASRRAAQRFGFSYEGIFRQATISKGHNRDTVWFACIDSEWPKLRQAYETWLDVENFDTNGVQKLRLADLTRTVRVSSDPILD